MQVEMHYMGQIVDQERKNSFIGKYLLEKKISIKQDTLCKEIRV